MKKTEIKSPWFYQGNELTEDRIPEWATSFVYRITGPDGKIYIGKKQLVTKRKVKIGKRAVAKERASRADGKAKTVKIVSKASLWQSYWSSCKELQENVKEIGEENFWRTILCFCFSKKNATYQEMKYQFSEKVLEVNSWNGNIGGNIYRHDTRKDLYDDFINRKKKII